MKNYCEIICVASDTNIYTPTGVTPIKEISCGAEVMCYDIDNGKLNISLIQRVVRSLHSACAVVSIENCPPIRLTLDHPVFVNGKGWCAVEPNDKTLIYGNRVNKLFVNDCCACLNRGEITFARITNIQKQNCDEYFYCLCVEGNQPFFANGLVARSADLSSLKPTDIEGLGIEDI